MITISRVLDLLLYVVMVSVLAEKITSGAQMASGARMNLPGLLNFLFSVTNACHSSQNVSTSWNKNVKKELVFVRTD